MTKPISRRNVLALAMAGAVSTLGTGAFAAAPERSLLPKARPEGLLKAFQKTADELIARANLGGDVGFAVADAATGIVQEGTSADLQLPPASVAKALTAAYALDVLGEGYRFRTRVLATGPIENGIVQGDLILAGGGDPILNTDALAGLAEQLNTAGVTGITGAFLIWGSALPQMVRIDATQPDHVGYNPPVSGLNLNFNRVHFEWKRAGTNYTVTMQARSSKYRPNVRVARMSVEARKAPVYVYEDRQTYDSWSVAKGALGDGGSRWLPIRKPEIYVGEVFLTLCKSFGISLPKAVAIEYLPEGTSELALHQSPALPEVLKGMLKFSTNLTAEVVGLTASKAHTGQVPASLQASAAEMNRWAEERLGVTGIGLVDHSGLNEASRVSAQQMMTALSKLRHTSALKPLLKPFNLLDEKGRPIPDHPIQVAAKTGTLNFVSGLAGFVDLPDGSELVFAIFSGDLDRRAALTVDQRERPDGGKSWNRRAKRLQRELIERWGVLYTGTT